MPDPIGRSVFGERQGVGHRWSKDDVIDRRFNSNRNWDDNEENEKLRERRLRRKVATALADSQQRHAKQDVVDYETRVAREERLEALREARRERRESGG